LSAVVVEPRHGPLILSMPHAGRALPDHVAERLNRQGRAMFDTDWWIERLYDFAGELDATVVRTTISRYVIDVNRDPSGASLYPGQASTGLCPLTTFDGAPIWRPGSDPDDREIVDRRALFFEPYHRALAEQIERVRAAHGFVLLYDCHSIRSRVPRLFDGELPDFNIGTNGGLSCAPEVRGAVTDVCAAAQGYSSVVDGRFKGGWITRHYGRPDAGVHAVQMELAQRTYMEEVPPWTFDDAKADAVRRVLRTALEAMLAKAGKAAKA
jgi:N-formylglutamate deformylase